MRFLHCTLPGVSFPFNVFFFFPRDICNELRLMSESLNWLSVLRFHLNGCCYCYCWCCCYHSHCSWSCCCRGSRMKQKAQHPAPSIQHPAPRLAFAFRLNSSDVFAFSAVARSALSDAGWENQNLTYSYPGNETTRPPHQWRQCQNITSIDSKWNKKFPWNKNRNGNGIAELFVAAPRLFLWQILIKCIIRIYYSNGFDLCKALPLLRLGSTRS